MGIVLPTFTDYEPECGAAKLDFFQMLASCIIGYADEGGTNHYYLNTVQATDNCDDLAVSEFWNCNNNGQSPEDALVNNVFAVDECGHMALKIFVNQGAI